MNTPSCVPVETNTRDRIIEASIYLFNNAGIEATSVAAISLRAGIATGNLTYHFPKKREIILEILGRFESSMEALNNGVLDGLLRGEKSVTAAETVQLLAETMRVIWSNRFFFTSMMSLHHLDETIPGRFSRIEQRALNGVAQLIQKALDAKVLSPLRYPNNTGMLADNIWHLLWGRIFFQRVGGANLESLEDRAIHDALMHVGAVIQPHATPEFMIAFCDEINAL